ncbi:MAG: arginine--tRNA ligase, partial [Planctomycetes bacterium]|nr:arginine--tRNA ligase [Planctomycetota bacterium]
DKKVLLRSDGTSVYITQDLGTALMKTEEHQLDGQIYVVGNEQNYHFKVLFRVLEKLGYDWAKNLHHLSYGMINLPEGKMKSREGTVVDADELIDELTALAKAEIESRQGDAVDDDIDLRARKIALAALKFMILAVSPQTTMLYDPKASVSFEGDTGPYVLYAYARIQRMLNDSGIPATDRDFDAGQLGDPSEVKLVLALLAFPGVVARAAADLNPSLVSTWLIETARAYHSHNRAVMILKAETEALRRARLALSRATAIGLKRGLYLLGIETVDRM